MTKAQTNILLVLLAGIFGVLVFHFASSNKVPAVSADETAVAASDDPREAVRFNGEQYAFGLAQMRGLLQTVATLDTAEIEGDNVAMAEAAAAQAPGRGGDHPNGFHEALPPGFRQMSRSMRQSLAMAAEAAREGDLAAYRAHRLKALQTCVACHENYRFEQAAQ